MTDKAPRPGADITNPPGQKSTFPIFPGVKPGGIVLLHSRSPSKEEGNDEHHDEDDEKDMRDPGRFACDTTETKNFGDDRDNEKNKRPT
jgi:hypothetical protein